MDQADLTQERFRDLLETADAIIWEAEAATLGLTYVSPGSGKDSRLRAGRMARDT